jgi:type II secretory pathway component PulK
MTGRTYTAAPSGRALDNQRGIALLIVLIIVALLTITVTEFTFNVQLDQHRTRNSVHALQASLLARSGLNIMEGFVVLDRDEPPEQGITWPGEDWWLQLKEFCKGLELDDGMLIKCRVRDESGKINVNLTKPPTHPVPPEQITKDKVVRDALRCIFERRNIDLDIVDRLPDYWTQDQGTRSDGTQVPAAEFSSLEDFAARVGIPNDKLPQLRGVLTALPSNLLRQERGSVGININTAPPEVLAAIMNPEEHCQPTDALNAIMERRSNGDPMKVSDIPAPSDDKNWSIKRSLLSNESQLYRLEASALTNVDPDDPHSGGIGQTVSELVLRKPLLRPGGKASFNEGDPRWTLETIDWHKEGGAKLFRTTPDEDQDQSDSDMTDQDQDRPSDGSSLGGN